MKLDQMAKKIIIYSGGKENISNITHCMTRLRFRYKNNDLVQKDKIVQLNDVLDVVLRGDEYQIVIGPHVNKLYKEVTSQLGIESNEQINENLDNKKRKINFENLLDTISAIFIPIIGVIAAEGTLRGFLAIIKQFNLMNIESTLFILLQSLGSTVFYFFPVVLGFSAAKHFKGNPYLGAVLGASLLTNDMINLVENGGQITLLSINIPLIDYSTTVLPIIFGTWIMCKVQHLAERYYPAVTQIVFVPLTALLVSYFSIIIFVGPISIFISNILSESVMFIYTGAPILAGGVLGLLWQASILTGVGWGFVPIFLNNYSTLGYDPIMALCTPSLFAQCGAAFAAGLRAKNKKFSGVGISAGIGCLLGVTEPAIYGINVPAKKPFLIASIGGAMGGIIAAIFKAKQFAIGPSGIFLYPVSINPDKGFDLPFFGLVIATLVAFVFSFLVTYYMGYQNTVLLDSDSKLEELI